jgi:DinB family protein
MVMTDERGRLVEPLREVPRRIAAATNGVDEVRLTLRTADEPWSVNDVLAHLRSVADHRMRYMRRMATGKHATLAYVSRRSELKNTDYLDRTFVENLAGFTAARTELIAWLESLPGDGWEHGAIIRGRPETVATYAGYLGEHELVHCDQIEALLR